jgi:DNA-binding transcriptional ArsR family regulator
LSSENKPAKQTGKPERATPQGARAEAILHPVRLRLIMTLTGREMTTQQIGEKLPDIAKASLYRHISTLYKAGVVRVVRETPVRGTVEKVYAIQEERAHLEVQELADATPEDHVRYFTAFVGSLLAQFRALAHENEADLIAQGTAYSTAPFYLTDEEYRQTAQELDALLRPRLANAPDGKRRRRLISVIVLPDKTPEPET